MRETRTRLTPRLVATLGYGMFFLMLVIPFYYVTVKLTLLAMVAAFVAFDMVRRRGVLPLHPTIGRLSLYYATLGLCFILLGASRAKDDAWFYVLMLYVAFPLIYTGLLLGVSAVRVLVGLQRTMIVAGIAIGVYVSLFFLSNIGVVPAWEWLGVDPLGVAHDREGVIAVRAGSISTLVFLLPFLIAKVIVPEPDGQVTIQTKWVWLALIPSLPVGILAGRKALLLVILLAPILTVGLSKLLPVGERVVVRRQAVVFAVGFLSLMLGGGIALQRALYVDYRGIYQRVTDGFILSVDTPDPGAYQRWGQFHALLGGWSKHPVIGVGHGVSLPDLVRSEEKPWRFELSYLALLYHTGVLGFLAYGIGVAWIFRAALRIIRGGGWWGRSMLPVLVGLISMVVAYGTNPYFDTFDAIWTIFLPLAFINVWLRSEGTSREPMWKRCS